MTKKRRQASVLTRQKPKRNRKARGEGLAIGPWLRRGLLFSAAAMLTFAVMQGYGVAKKRLFDGRKASGVADWHVVVRLPDEQSLPEPKLNDIVQTVARQLGNGDAAGMQRAALAVQKLESFSRVHVLRLAEQRVAVNLRLRVPLACIEADKLRFVGEDGAVFGQADSSASPCPGPKLSGILSPQRNVALESDFTLSLRDDEKALIKEAIELMNSGREQRFAFSALSYKRYRGFFATLPNGVAGSSEANSVEIALGRAPFTDKVGRLAGILSKLKEKGEQAQRIELDYQGKAFVKLKKL